MRLPIVQFAPVLAALTFALTASAEVPKLGKSSVAFTAKGPGGLKINGTGNKVSVEKDGDRVKFVSSIKNMKTGIGLRDKHLNKALRVPENDKDPKTASFTFDESKLKRSGGKVTGAFSMNGKTHDVPVTYTVEGKDVTANFIVNITQYGLEEQCYMGVCCENDVAVTVKLTLKD
jgi:hypothetical protein